MKIEEIEDNLGKEVLINGSTLPLTNTKGFIAQPTFIYNRILLTGFHDSGNVIINFYLDKNFIKFIAVNPRHLTLKSNPKPSYMKWLELDNKGTSVEYYSESLERWDNILNISLAELKLQSKFRVAPKYVYLEGNYCAEDLLDIAKDLKK